MKTRKLLFAAGVLVMTLFASSLAGIQPASAATCSGRSCDYRDPEGSGCEIGAITVGQTFIPSRRSDPSRGLTVQLRYSPSCRTIWARAFGGSDINWIYVERVTGPDGKSPRQLGSGRWTGMLYDAGYTGRACGQARSTENNGPITKCTRAF